MQRKYSLHVIFYMSSIVILSMFYLTSIVVDNLSISSSPPTVMEVKQGINEAELTAIRLKYETLVGPLLLNPNLWNNSFMEDTENTSSKVLKSLTEISREYSKHPNTVILTFANDLHLKDVRKNVLNNIVYAFKHGIGFMVEQRCNKTMVPFGDLHYCKIWALLETMRSYDRIIWIDTDALIINKTVNIADIFDSNNPNHDLILADHSDNLNNGVILLRKSAWLQQFLVGWWKRSHEQKSSVLFEDQGVLYFMIMDYLRVLHPDKCRYLDPNECALEPFRSSYVHYCFNRHLDCYGYTYGNRGDIGKISILPQNNPQYRINQWFYEGPWGSLRSKRKYERWKSDDYYRSGDMIAHTKDANVFMTDNVVNGNIRDLMKYLNSFE